MQSEETKETDIVDYHVIHLRNSRNSQLKHENILENEKLLGQPINIYDANNGKDVVAGINYPDEDFKFEFKYSYIGEVGCYISHLLLIKSFTQSRYKYSVIFEDDFEILHDNLHQEILDILLNKLNDKDFDILYLGNTNNHHHQQVIDNIYTINVKDILWGTHAFLVNLQNAEKVYKSLLHVNAPIDIKLKDNINKGMIQAYVIYPILVDQNTDKLKSDIRPCAFISARKKEKKRKNK